MTVNRFAYLAFVLLVAAACRGKDPARLAPVRLVDRTESTEKHRAAIDGLALRVLSPSLAEQAFVLEDLPADPILTFAIGQRPSARREPVSFEIWHEPAEGDRVRLYSEELSEIGWRQGEVDLSGRDLRNSKLVFRRSGPARSLRSSFWGNPVLLPGRTRKTSDLSVILISFDTLRADRLGIYGYSKNATPSFDSLAAGGTTYASAYSPSTWTRLSHTSLFYGLYPRNLYEVCTIKAGCVPAAARPAAARPLAEILRERGLLTAGFTGGGFVSDKFGFGEGFDSYYTFHGRSNKNFECRPERFDGPDVFARSTQWLDRHGQAPFFLFIHTYDTHDRCIKPRAFRRLRRWPDPGPEERKRVEEDYNGLVSQIDTLLGKLVDDLNRLGIADRTAIIVTSDHGQAFWEHGFQGHGCALPPYEELARVPLIVRIPGVRSGGRIELPVSGIDVAPTILATLGIERPDWMDGRALPGLGLQDERSSEPVYVHCGRNLAVRSGVWKLLTARDRPEKSKLFDLSRDPDEKVNLATRDGVPADLREWAQEYWEATRESGAQRIPDRIDPRTRERLRALGYVD